MPPRYTDKFKSEAVKQVTVNGYEIKDTANRLGHSSHSLYLKATLQPQKF